MCVYVYIYIYIYDLADVVLTRETPITSILVRLCRHLEESLMSEHVISSDTIATQQQNNVFRNLLSRHCFIYESMFYYWVLAYLC